MTTFNEIIGGFDNLLLSHVCAGFEPSGRKKLNSKCIKIEKRENMCFSLFTLRLDKLIYFKLRKIKLKIKVKEGTIIL